MKTLKWIIALQIIALIAIVLINIIPECQQKRVMVDSEDVMKMLRGTYMTAYLTGSNNAVEALNKGVPITMDYITTHLFKDSIAFFSKISFVPIKDTCK